MKNPSLRQEPIYQSAPVLPLDQKTSILDWLEETGRLAARNDQDDRFSVAEEDVAEIMTSEDLGYDDFDDDDEVLPLDDEPI
ncbi:DUF3134 domain-containing protein [Merismopedia glauca]|uniref:DUF3134 domain-containing protein n=1 Tax=Merismopedia glauca CCAP 1448/3 TaxID=1296344 RepID=A0A2T1C1A0_9CYAN|nr:DUF3134 domain-containing protein [Merismopedia glauca]PSB01937.1 hypothetical protein C7B64_15645 [Merismopedia glauca CCAP 1448/3]